MAVSGVSGSGTSIYGNRNVLSGLASGMDTESMIENMTQATRIKIAQQNQKKTLLGWKQTAYQGISTQLIEFSKKYMDFTSPTNLLSSAFYDQSIVTSVGKNNALVSATGKTNSKVEINGVKQLATSATHTADRLSALDLTSGEFDITKETEYAKLAGGSLTFQYGTESYTITLSADADLKTPQGVVDEINKQLNEMDIQITGSDKSAKLGEKIEAKLGSDGKTFTLGLKDGQNAGGNTLKLTGVSDTVKEAFALDETQLKDGIDLSDPAKKLSVTVDESKLKQKQKMTEHLEGKTLTLSLNGQKREISLLTKEDIARLDTFSTADEKNKEYAKILTEKLNYAFGSGKIDVNFAKDSSGTAGKLTFKVTNSEDNVLKVTAGSGGVLGTNGIFGFKAGDGNRINLDSTLESLESLLGKKFFPQGTDSKDLFINKVKIGTYTKDTTLRQIIGDINSNAKANIKATYSETSNQFVLTSKDTGKGSKVHIEDGLAADLFGAVEKSGDDAIITVTVNNVQKELTRPSNEIDIDGLKVTISGEFGYNGGQIDPAEKVTFNSKPDTDKMFDAIKTMVEDYNKIVDSVYKEMTTKPNRDYQPLTDEQKKEMSKEQIEKWEEKAKEGLLFADTQLRSLHDSLRFIFNPGGEAGAKLRAMGIETSKDYKDGGKIKLNEQKLRAALESDAEGVKQAFNALPSSKTQSGIMNSASKGGVMTQLKEVTDRFASTSLTRPGILVAHAGSPSSPNSMMKNAMKKEMDSIDNILKSLDVKLKKEIDRYNAQFTQLETLISQMNAQSGQLAGLMGGGM